MGLTDALLIVLCVVGIALFLAALVLALIAAQNWNSLD